MAKKYYWLKLKQDFFEDDVINWIEEQKNGKDYVIFYLKLCLKSIKNEGTLIRKVGDMLIPYDKQKLSEITKTPIDTVVVAMQLFEKLNLISILENGEIYINQMENMIGSETDKAQLMRNKREREKELNGNNVTNLLLNCYTEKEIDKELDKELDKDLNIDINKEKHIKQNDIMHGSKMTNVDGSKMTNGSIKNDQPIPYINTDINLHIINSKENVVVEKENDIKEKPKTNKEGKTLLEEYVYLFKEEYVKLCDKYSDEIVENTIQELNAYIGATGRKYKSHYHTIMMWLNKKGIKAKVI